MLDCARSVVRVPRSCSARAGEESESSQVRGAFESEEVLREGEVRGCDGVETAVVEIPVPRVSVKRRLQGVARG
jgi:hypothetical protein